jgi:hypothetical protein
MASKYELLNSITEDIFRQEALIPLLGKMGFEHVRLRHGSKEYGKDITYSETSKLNLTYYAVVAKVGDISGGASGGRNTILISTIKDQILQAFTIPIEDVTDPHSQEVYVNQVLVWTTGKISDNASKRIIKDIKVEYRNNVTFIDGERTIELLDQYYPTYFTIGDIKISNYFDKAKATYNRLDELYAIGGPNAQKQIPSIFVSPTLELIPKIKSKQAKQEHLPNKRYSFAKLLALNTNVFIQGQMGSGKSTILRKLLIEIIDKNVRELNKYPIPVLMRYKRLDLKNNDAITIATQNEYAKFSENQEGHDISNLLKDGRFVILLDGLDELESSAEIDNAINISREFAKKYPKTRLVITSRMMEVLKTSDFLTGFTVYRIEDFNVHQMKELITNWFGVDNQQGKQLIKLVSEPMTLSTLPLTPLTLSLVAILYQSGLNELPASLTELFEKYTELALGRWDIGKDIASQIDWKKKLLVMRKISWDMVTNYILETDLKEIKDQVDKLSSERGLAVDNNVLFRELVERSGLFVLNLNGSLEFKHRAFVDFFAAGELNNKTDAINIVVEKFPEAWWTRAIFFACGLKPEGEGEEYIKAIMQNVDKSDCGAFNYAMQLGLLAQATYLAHRDIKTAALRDSLITFVDAWDELAIHFQNAYKKGRIPKPVPHLFLLTVFTGAVRYSAGSATLSGAVAHLTDEVLNPKHIVTTIDESTRKRNEWFAFILAVSSAAATNVADFIALFESNIILDPAFIQIGQFEAEFLLEEEWVAEDTKDALKDLIKEQKKKLKRNKGYLDRLATHEPFLLASNSTSKNLEETNTE